MLSGAERHAEVETAHKPCRSAEFLKRRSPTEADTVVEAEASRDAAASLAAEAAVRGAWRRGISSS